MNHFPSTSWGKPRNESVDAYSTFPIHQSTQSKSNDNFSLAIQHTQQPIVTGTSVLGIKYKDGVMLAADNLASYGSLARFKDIQRLHPIGDSTVLAASGDMADFQQVQRMLENIMTEEALHEDGHTLSPSQIYAYLSNVMYEKRTAMNPFWNAFILGGVDAVTSEPFLAYVDLLGTTYSAPTLATGYGNHLAQPLLRRAMEKLGKGDEGWKEMTEEMAKKILMDSMKVLFYRDARSLNKFQIAKVTKEGIHISESMSVETSWGYGEGLRGYGNSDETM